MGYHIVTGPRVDAAALGAEAAQGLRPRHAVAELAEALDARIHHAEGAQPSIGDRLCARVMGRADAWALARQIAGRVIGDGCVVYCTGEDVGIPLAAICARRKIKARIAVFAHNLDRPRSRIGLRLFGAARAVSLFVACARHQTEYLAASVGVPAKRLWLVWDSVDMQFFTPGPASAHKARPLVVATGLEQRDYRTLAAATADMDVDVRITGFSRDARARSRAFPPQLPWRWQQGFVEWRELVQLYRDADVVVVSTFPTTYAAGVQSLMEAMSCARPVIATATEGLREYVNDPGTVLAVPPGDGAAMRTAIAGLLADPGLAVQMARRGHDQAVARFDQAKLMTLLISRLRALAPPDHQNALQQERREDR